MARAMRKELTAKGQATRNPCGALAVRGAPGGGHRDLQPVPNVPGRTSAASGRCHE
ncbi:hypothetical protein GCM10009577_55630 [Streptomyces javensis]